MNVNGYLTLPTYFLLFHQTLSFFYYFPSLRLLAKNTTTANFNLCAMGNFIMACRTTTRRIFLAFEIIRAISACISSNRRIIRSSPRFSDSIAPVNRHIRPFEAFVDTESSVTVSTLVSRNPPHDLYISDHNLKDAQKSLRLSEV